MLRQYIVGHAHVHVHVTPPPQIGALAQVRADLRLQHEGLVSMESKVDVAAVEVDLALSHEYTTRMEKLQRAKLAAAAASSEREVLEHRRFEKVFSSLERIRFVRHNQMSLFLPSQSPTLSTTITTNITTITTIDTTTTAITSTALSEAYRSLCVQGDAHLRYSREPVSLFKDGVLMYAKPDRSQWREGKSLSGGQQAILGLALNMGFQMVCTRGGNLRRNICSSAKY